MVQMDVQAGCCGLSSHTPSELFQTLPILPEEGREEWMVWRPQSTYKDLFSE